MTAAKNASFYTWTSVIAWLLVCALVYCSYRHKAVRKPQEAQADEEEEFEVPVEERPVPFGHTSQWTSPEPKPEPEPETEP